MPPSPLSRYGQLIERHGGQLPDDLSGVSTAQLRGAVVDLMDAMEGLQTAFAGLDLGRWRDHALPPIALARPVTPTVFLHAAESDTLMTMGWSGNLGNIPVVAAPREALEQELRTLHAHVCAVEIEMTNRLGVLRAVRAGQPVTEEGVVAWLADPVAVIEPPRRGRLSVTV